MNVTEVKPKIRDLKDNKALEFSEKVLMLFAEVESFIENVANILNNPSELRAKSLDYIFLMGLKQRIAVQPFAIKSVLEGLKSDLPTIETYDKEFASFIKDYKSRSYQEINSLMNLLYVTRQENLRKLILNFEIYLQYLENITDDGIKEKLKLRLLLIKKYADEVDEIEAILHDLEEKEMLHRDILFFTDRLNKYFEGGATADNFNFKGLQKTFKDEKLGKDVYGNNYVNRLTYLSKFLHRIDEQIAFVSELVSILETAGQSGEWQGFLGPNGFYENIGTYASKFEAEFQNQPYASMLLKGKKTIGEQPLVWLKLIRNMWNFMQKLANEKNFVMSNMHDFLLQIFSQRRNELLNSISRVADDTNKSISYYLASHQDMAFFKQLRIRLEKLESKIDIKWRKIKRQFKVRRTSINSKYFELMPKLQDVIAQSDFSEEAKNLYRLIESFSAYVAHKDQLLSTFRGQSSSLFALIFDFARIGENITATEGIIKALERKSVGLSEKMLDDLKKLVKEALIRYVEIVTFLKSLNLRVDVLPIEEKIRRFIADEYRGEIYGRA